MLGRLIFMVVRDKAYHKGPNISPTPLVLRMRIAKRSKMKSQIMDVSCSLFNGYGFD